MGYYSQTKNLPQPRLKKKLPPFPINRLPACLRKAAERLNYYTQVPVELIVSVMLTILSLVCQYITSVRLPHSGVVKPLSLYLLTIAESGEGKSFILKLLMKPLLECFSSMNEDYQLHLAEYRHLHRIWKTTQQALEATLRQAIKRGYDGETEMAKLEDHNRKEPQKPVRPKFIYEDVSHKALIQGLSLHAEAGIITDEGISFIRGMLKNHLALLNKGWDGGTYDFQRADGESYELELCLMISLMVQPGVIDSYLNKNGDIAKSSGFISRFLITMVESNIGYRTQNADSEDLEHALTSFYSQLSKLLDIFKRRFYDEDSEKLVIELSDEAKELLHLKRQELERKIIPGGELNHICDFISKFPEHAVRVAAIFERVGFVPTDTILGDLFRFNTIDKGCMQNALDVMAWYTEQARVLFYPMSERCQFEKDVHELQSWIANALMQRSEQVNEPVRVSSLLQRGPNRLRKWEALEPVLVQLSRQKEILIIRNAKGGPAYIIPGNNIMQVVPTRFIHLFPHGYVILSLSDDVPVQPFVELEDIMPHY